MADKPQHNSTDDDAIAPAQVSLSAQPDGAPSDSTDTFSWREHRLALAGLAVGIIALLGVIFLLPDLVTPVQAPETSNAAAAGSGSGSGSEQTPQLQGPTESPWQDAQFAKARREAQAVLQDMLEKQEELEAMEVELWAEDAYLEARQMAERADQHYQSREFDQAQALYENSLDRFEQLLEQSESVVESALATGEQAIEDGDAGLAQEQFELAAHIRADDDRVETGLQRAAVLEDVLAEIAAGKKLERDNQLEQAKQRYQAALQLDQQSQIARERLAEINQAIADRDFGKHMSAGFAAMSQDDYDQAIAAFQNALKIKPDAGDARNALKQAENESTQTTLQALLAEAREHEQKEEWQAAVDSYEQALQVDGNLAEAKVGAIRAGSRAQIDKDLERILAAPERLTTPAVHRDYQAFYEDTKRIRNPGPRLSDQLAQLEEALHLAVQPVMVQLRSDDATNVTVNKVGKLGSFEQTEITLKPGTYTAVGTRKGYRDVRQEFTVSADGDNSPITIQCVEKISKG